MNEKAIDRLLNDVDAYQHEDGALMQYRFGREVRRLGMPLSTCSGFLQTAGWLDENEIDESIEEALRPSVQREKLDEIRR